MTWLSYIMAVQYFLVSVPFMARLKEKAHSSIEDDGTFLLLIVTSGLVMGQGAFMCGSDGCSSYQALLALILALDQHADLRSCLIAPP